MRRSAATAILCIAALAAWRMHQHPAGAGRLRDHTAATILTRRHALRSPVLPRSKKPRPRRSTTGQTAAVGSKARVQIAPIVGATVEAAAPLTERMAEASSGTWHRARRQRRPLNDPCDEGLFFRDLRGQGNDRDLCLGRTTIQRQPASPDQGPAEDAVKQGRRLERRFGSDDAGDCGRARSTSLRLGSLDAGGVTHRREKSARFLGADSNSGRGACNSGYAAKSPSYRGAASPGTLHETFRGQFQPGAGRRRR